MNKDFKFEIKSVGEDGTFEGLLSVYNNVDLGNDLVEPGAFTKTIQENRGVVPMLWQHDTKSPIGTLELEDSAEGLKVKGRFVLDVMQAREAYALVKNNVIKGLSIGYVTVKSTAVKGIRHLKELRLLEGSVVTFPMNQLATISDVKAEGKADFVAELERARIYSARHMMQDALMNALDSIVWSMESDEDKIQAAGESIDQFKVTYLELLPKLFALWEGKSDHAQDQKTGRRLSESSRASIGEAITNLQALLGEEAASVPDGSHGTASTPETEAAKSTEPEALHSLLTDFGNQLKSSISAL